MRVAGAPVGVGEVVAALRALEAVNPVSRRESFFALRASLCSSRADFDLFAEAFAVVFAPGEPFEDPFEALGKIEKAALPRVGMPTEQHSGGDPRGRAGARPPGATRSCCARRTSPSTATPSARSRGRCSCGWRGARRSGSRAARAAPAGGATCTTCAPPSARRCATAASCSSGATASPPSGPGGSCSCATSPARWRRTRGCCCSTCRRASPRAPASRRSCSARGSRASRASWPAAIRTARWRAPPSTSRTGRAARGSAPRWPSSTASTAAGSGAAP